MSELWKARLLPGSFRGVPFFIASHEAGGGRHSKKHEPPDRDSGFSEDIGKKTPDFKIEAHVLGDNYFFIRDALIKVMESGGSGLLVHPYLGIKSVQPVNFAVRETTELKNSEIASWNRSNASAGPSGGAIASRLGIALLI